MSNPPKPDFKLCIIIPCYNHGREISGYLPIVAAHGIPIIVIDDGSAEEEAQQIEAACRATGATYLRCDRNKGKWQAVKVGTTYAKEAGFTHMLQCDADGQHDASVIPAFAQTAKEHPQAIICGTPIYGDDIPKARLKGRCISNFFATLETAGACTIDTMCGFRLYPIAALAKTLAAKSITNGMPGDIETLVHLFWCGYNIIAKGVRVIYPEGARSNFHMLRDNLRISWAHTKLCTAALLCPWRLFKTRKVTYIDDSPTG